jgi:hypothetical protein
MVFLRISAMTAYTLFAGVFLFIPETSLAEENQVHVDKDASDGGDGSKGSPYKSIKKALEEAKNGDTIRIAGGTYDDPLTIEKEVELKGSGRSKTNISGAIIAKKKLELENLSVTAKNAVAITVESGVTFKAEGIEIKGFSRNGINALPGKGKISFIDGTIHGSRGKGIYIQKGHTIEITGSRFYDNGEEALDIRNNVSGIIKNNAIYSNGEGGIEIIIGDSDIQITNNKITKNKASGIASQFYASAGRIGKIVLANNTISSNGKFGLDCNIPSGGNPSPGYWQRSLELTTNTLEQNGKEEISPFCKIIEAVDKEEEKDNAITETDPDQSLQTEEQKAANTLSEEELRREEEAWKKVEELSSNSGTRQLKVEGLKQAILNQNPVKRFFFGTYSTDFSQLKNESMVAGQEVNILKELIATTPTLQPNTSLQGVVEEQESKVKDWQDFIMGQESKISLYAFGYSFVAEPIKLLVLSKLF